MNSLATYDLFRLVFSASLAKKFFYTLPLYPYLKQYIGLLDVCRILAFLQGTRATGLRQNLQAIAHVGNGNVRREDRHGP